ncbi:MAG: dihydrolipoamide acetyltransferase family protein [Thermoplasmata archaeon]
MTYEFRLPDIGEGVAEGEVVKWFVQEGETVQEDAPLVSVLTDKANVEIPSPKTGKVLHLHAQVGEKVKVGGLLVTLDAEGTAPASAPHVPVPPPSAPPSEVAPASPLAPAGTSGAGRILATPSIRRLAAEKGIDLATIRGSGPNGRVTEADLGSSASGTAGAAAIPVAPEASTTATTTPRTAPPPSTASTPSAPPAPLASTEEVERVPIRGVRRVIFDHMAEATRRAAHFTYVEEIDVSELVKLRDKMAKHVEKNGVKLSYLPFIVKACAAGLRDYPRMNARMDDERNELVVYQGIHIGIATAAPDGLIVPVLRNVERKSIAHLAREIQDLASRGRDGKLQRDELTGGTFTITSLGALGGVLATPILNYPEVAILGVHKIVKRPVYLADGSIGPASLMNLSVSLDHRVLDGITGAQFLSVVKAHLEDPHQLFAELA